MAAMRSGDFDAAHAISDAVLAARDPAGRDDPNLPYHMRWVWDGRAFDGRHVLVRCYHGLGDTLQFARFLPAARAKRRVGACRSAARAAPAPGVSARPRSPDPVPAGAAREAARMRYRDHGTAPRPARAARRHSPAIGSPGSAFPDRRARHRALLDGWEWDRSRSVPLARLLLACAGSEMRFVSLQRGAAAETALASRFINRGDDNTERHPVGGADPRVGSGDYRRYDGRASGGHSGRPGLGAAPPPRGLAMDGGSRGFAVVPVHAALSAGDRRRLGGAVAAAGRRSQTPGGRLTPRMRASDS